jgi:hypothetical protein
MLLAGATSRRARGRPGTCALDDEEQSRRRGADYRNARSASVPAAPATRSLGTSSESGGSSRAGSRFRRRKQLRRGCFAPYRRHGGATGSHGTSGIVTAESVAKARFCCSRRAALGAREESSIGGDEESRSSTTTKVTWEGSTDPRRNFEPHSATRRGSSTAVSHVWRSTAASTRWARIAGVLPLLPWFGCSSGKTPSRSSGPQRREPRRLLGFSEWS